MCCTSERRHRRRRDPNALPGEGGGTRTIDEARPRRPDRGRHTAEEGASARCGRRTAPVPRPADREGRLRIRVRTAVQRAAPGGPGDRADHTHAAGSVTAVSADRTYETAIRRARAPKAQVPESLGLLPVRRGTVQAVGVVGCSAVALRSWSQASRPAPRAAVAVGTSDSTWSPVQVSSVWTCTPPLTLRKVHRWTPSSMRRPSPIAGPLHRMQLSRRSSWTVEVMERVVAGVDGVAGAGVVQWNREPGLRRPWSRRSAVLTGGC